MTRQQTTILQPGAVSHFSTTSWLVCQWSTDLNTFHHDFMSRRHWNDTSCHGVTGTMRFRLKPSHFLAELLGLVDYDIACPNWYDLLYLNGLNGFDREVDDWWGIRSTVGQVFDDCGQKVKTQKHVFLLQPANSGRIREGYIMIYHHMSSSHVRDMS